MTKTDQDHQLIFQEIEAQSKGRDCIFFKSPIKFKIFVCSSTGKDWTSNERNQAWIYSKMYIFMLLSI